MDRLLDPNAPATGPIRLRYGHAIGLGASMYVLGFVIMACPAQIVTSALGMPGGVHVLLVVAPPLLPAALTLFGNLRMQRDFERRARGWCVGCGYDLRGSFESERCPECGRRVRRVG
jgi:hypothetical protein